MDAITERLFGEFPRAVATDTVTGQLRQWVVHSPGEFDIFTDAVDGKRNPYVSISWRPVGGEVHLDKCYVDFDTPQKPDWPVFDADEPLPEDEIVARMRNDSAVADAVLGQPIAEARALIERAAENNTPAIAVFSGFGIHVHLLYREKERPEQQIETTARKYRGDLNLDCVDEQPIGDVKRVVRVPNCERVHIETDGERIIAQRPTGVHTVPLVPADFDGLDAPTLLEVARTPRHPDPPDVERPVMQTHENYIQQVDEADQSDQRTVDASIIGEDDDLLAFCLEEWLQLPCMYERIQQPSPSQPTRFNCAVLLLNLGFSVTEVTEIFSRIGWRDFDRQKTKGYVQQIYRKGYSDMSCASLRTEGLCVHADAPEDCPTYGWSNGRAEWKTTDYQQ